MRRTRIGRILKMMRVMSNSSQVAVLNLDQHWQCTFDRSSTVNGVDFGLEFVVNEVD